MSEALVTVRKAWKPHQCTKCLGYIQPGELYEDARMPPNGEFGNTTWWRSASHLGAYER